MQALQRHVHEHECESVSGVPCFLHHFGAAVLLLKLLSGACVLPADRSVPRTVPCFVGNVEQLLVLNAKHSVCCAVSERVRQ